MTVQRSDYSDAVIDADSARSIDISLGDGRRRRLLVTAADVEEIASKGADISSSESRTLAWLRRHGPSVAKWGAAVLIAGLVIPAATKQWSDRTQALKLKEGMITAASSAVSDASHAANELVHSANPKEVRSLRRQTLLDSFVHRESILDPSFRVYFDGTQALSTWLKYRRIVYEYVALSCCDSEARNDVRDIHAFFSDHRSLVSDYPPPPYKRGMPGVWAVLKAGSQPSPKAFATDYAWVGSVLISARGIVWDDLRTTKPQGFSQGPHDFACDVLGPIC